MTIALTNLGYNQTEIQCAANIVKVESNYHPTSFNKTSKAAGMYQIVGLKLPMTIVGQTKQFNAYLHQRYKGSACKAWLFWQKNKWY